MAEVLSVLGWLLLGISVGGAGILVLKSQAFSRWRNRPGDAISTIVASHFGEAHLDNITIAEREFPYRVRADLQMAVDRMFQDNSDVVHFCGVRKEFSHAGINLSDCITPTAHYEPVSVPPKYEEVCVGDDAAVRCLETGLWLLQKHRQRYAVLLAPATKFGDPNGITFQVGTVNNPEGTQISQQFFQQLEEAVKLSASYRGKILSLEQEEHSYSGESSGIKVHKLRTVERDQVILPRATLDLLDRNILQFVQQRSALTRFHQATKKGILFYGPPGTGKTHTIQYLARALQDHTTLLITSEQVGLLGEYMTLARLLQPSMVVIEDADLIARERTQMGSACEEILLNKLLNEMDGLREDVDILFILTTNRPETLETALASRPGRIDQAIEFPLPNDEGREKLVHLYAPEVEIAPDVVSEIVKRTERVSAAFIKELMRRSIQFHLETNATLTLEIQDVENALHEMLFAGGSLNLKLLGADHHPVAEAND